MSSRNLSLNEVDQLVEFASPERLELVGDETTALVLKILTYGITPLICALGISGNILSIMILKRHGLQKCSNILLISLAFADLCVLIGFNNIPNILHNSQGNGRFIYSKGVSYFLYALYIIFFMLDYGMGMTTLSLPVIITIERLVAVFLPLRFPSIVTPTRTWVAVGIVYFYNLSFMTYTCFWYKLKYGYDNELNRTVGVMTKSELFYKDLHAIPTLEEVYFSVKVQPLFTLVGCVLIIFKVKLVSKKRLTMTAGSNTTTTKTGPSKTTQTLLAVCLVYIVVCAILALPTYLPEDYISYSLTSNDPSNLSVIMYQVMGTLGCLNSSWNFIVYIALNKNFRDTFQEIIGKCPCGSRSGAKGQRA